MSESAPAAQPRRAAFSFIFITALLDVLALGLVIPVLPGLVSGFAGGDTTSAARYLGLFGTAWALMQFIFSPVLGSLSDRIGRRPVILLSNLGLGLDYILMALAPSLGWLFVGRVLSGITAASIPAASAYIADVTPPEQRAARFGMLGAAFGIGFVLGPALGGVLGSTHPHLPFWLAAALSLTNALYGLFVLPESLPPERRSPFSWARANPIGSLALLRTHRQLLGLAGVTLLMDIAHVVFPSVFVLYVNHRYGLNERDVGLFLAAWGVCSLGVQAGLVQPAVSWLGERWTLIVGLLFGMASMLIYGLAPTTSILWLGTPVGVFWGLAGPALQGLMTRHVQPSEQGQLQGANGSLMGLAEMLGPFLFTLTFAAGIRPSSAVQLPGAPFLVAALLLGAAAAAGVWVTRAAPGPVPEGAESSAPRA
ncbi:TCR/Tet family MFS transporter [Myxococcaceae bacterium GXIMD 01537]